MSWLNDSAVKAKWTALQSAISDGKVPAADFAEASLAIISVFDLISGMSIPANDMKGNANTVKSLATSASIQDAIEAELAGKSEKEVKKIVGDGKTMTCAVLWLVR